MQRALSVFERESHCYIDKLRHCLQQPDCARTLQPLMQQLVFVNRWNQQLVLARGLYPCVFVCHWHALGEGDLAPRAGFVIRSGVDFRFMIGRLFQNADFVHGALGFYESSPLKVEVLPFRGRAASPCSLQRLSSVQEIKNDRCNKNVQKVVLFMCGQRFQV